MQALSQIEPQDSDLPLFSEREIREARCFNESDAFTVRLKCERDASELLSVENAAWLTFLVQMAILNPKASPNVRLNTVNFTSIFDGVQLLRIWRDKLEIKFEFYWVRNLAKRF